MKSFTKRAMGVQRTRKQVRPTAASERLYQAGISSTSGSFADFAKTADDLDPRSMPRIIFKSPQKKPISNEDMLNIPVMSIIPPIALHEDSLSETENSENDVDEEEFNLTKEELRLKYKELVSQYKTAADQFNRLEKKRVKMISHIDILRQQVKDLEAEQVVVQAEFDRLGLGVQK